MKSKWVVFNNAYIFFGTTLYVGVLWALHFFCNPTWQVYNAATYYDHFIPPTQAATRFFTRRAAGVPLSRHHGLAGAEDRHAVVPDRRTGLPLHCDHAARCSSFRSTRSSPRTLWTTPASRNAAAVDEANHIRWG